MNSEFRKFTLDNGLTLLAEKHPFVRGCSLGLWVRVGSRQEAPSQNGLSHIIEHMVFKGTATRSPREIATCLESIGGDLNAFTDKEYTCFHASVLSEHVDRALDALADLVIRPLFPRAELERERKILLQELSLIEDSPDDWILDLFLQNVWKGDPLGQPVIGNRHTILGVTRAQLVKYFRQHYRPDNMVLSVAGNIDFERLREGAEKAFAFGPVQKVMPAEVSPPAYQARRKHVSAYTDQTHCLVGFEGLGFRDRRRFDLLCLSFYLGGGMSSRLFQEIREKAALAYAVDCDAISFTDTGLFTFFLTTGPRSLSKCLSILARELDALCEKPLPEEALEAVKGQLKGAVLMASDEMDSRQESLGRNEMLFGRYISVEEVVREIDAVTPGSLHALAQELFHPRKESVLTLGKHKPRTKLSALA